jgi:hypothetical protein
LVAAGRGWSAAGRNLSGRALFPRRPAKLTDKDRVVLADFANTTGDPVFDDALRQGSPRNWSSHRS